MCPTSCDVGLIYMYSSCLALGMKSSSAGRWPSTRRMSTWIGSTRTGRINSFRSGRTETEDFRKSTKRFTLVPRVLHCYNPLLNDQMASHTLLIFDKDFVKYPPQRKWWDNFIQTQLTEIKYKREPIGLSTTVGKTLKISRRAGTLTDLR